MSAGLGFASIGRSIGIEAISAVPPQPFNSIAMSRLEGRPVVGSPQQLRLHPALEGVGWTAVIDEFNEAARLPNPFVPKPILIATNGVILSGFGRWRLAVFEGWLEINCIEYSLSKDESLRAFCSQFRALCSANSQPDDQRDFCDFRTEAKASSEAPLLGLVDKTHVRKRPASR